MNFKDREQKIKKKLSTDEAIIISGKEDLYYLSGFIGSSGLIVISDKKSILMVDGRYFEKAQKDAVADEIVLMTDFIENIKDIFERLKVKRCYFDGDWMTFNTYVKMSSELGSIDLKSGAENWLKDLRAVKDDDEIEVITQGVRLSKNAFNDFINQVDIWQMTERACVNELEYRLKKCGENISFDTLVLAGENSSLPHGSPSDRIIQKNDSVIFDFGIKYKNYCTDNTRTVILDNPIMERYLKIVKKAFDAGLSQIFPNNEIKKADIAVRDVLEKEGVIKHFLHSSGHGIGLSVHEYPTLSFRSEGFFEKGMIITLEPGLYFEGLGGVRFEEMILVTKNSCEIL